MKNTSINSGRLSSSKRIAPLAYSCTVILAVAGSLILLPLATTLSKAMRSALNAAASAPAIPVQSQTGTFYLRGTGPVDNPPTLFLNATAPTATAEKFKDSAGITRNGGNLWKEVGTWSAAPALTAATLTSLSDLHVWLGLKNSDDQGTYFDLRVEAYKNSTLVTSGQSLCITGVTRNPSAAKEVVLGFDPFSAASFNGTSDVLKLKILTRVGTTAAGGDRSGGGFGALSDRLSGLGNRSISGRHDRLRDQSGSRPRAPHRARHSADCRQGLLRLELCSDSDPGPTSRRRCRRCFCPGPASLGWLNRARKPSVAEQPGGFEAT